MTHFGPTFGLTMESRMNWTMASIPFIHPEGAALLLDKNFLTGIITATPTNKATIHNMKTCLVTDMEYKILYIPWPFSIPNKSGK